MKMGRATAVVAAAFGCMVFATPVLSQTAIKIGLVQTFSGPLSIVGIEAADGFELFLEQNQNKIAGRPVTLIKEDDASNPTQGLERVRRLVEREQVHVLTGITSSAVAYAVRGYVDQRQVPLVIMGSAGANGLTDQQGSPYIFRTSFSNRQLGGPFGPYACSKLGYKKIAVMASDFVTGHEQSAAFEAEFTKAGCQVVKKIMAPLGTSDYAPFLEPTRIHRRRSGLGDVFRGRCHCLRQAVRRTRTQRPSFRSSDPPDWSIRHCSERWGRAALA